MFHRRIALAVACSLIGMGPASSSAGLPEPRLVRVPFTATVGIRDLQEAGLDIVSVQGSREAMVFEWPGDEQTLARIGASPELVDEHPGASAASRAARETSVRPRPAPARVRSAVRSDGRFRIESLPPFGSGSMGGYWTLDEVKMELDSLVADDPSGIVADKIDTLGVSRQGRPIWGLRLGTTVSGPDTRPAIVYNALTHAREPEGMQALFYFVNDLLSGYGTDPWKTYLLENRRITICPVVNPDGYQVNVNTYVSSGGTSFGMWRKNARDNNANLVFDTGDGVDINRNFPYQWNFDNVGSSGTPSSDIYRGPSAASEPETQAQRDLIIALQPATALSFHTYGDLFLHPWGYTATATSDSSAFYEWDDEATFGNGYDSGQSTRVLYEVNGEFNDWCYGETVAKPRLFSWTPETGNPNDGFWPPPSRIGPLAQENLRECYLVAAIAGPDLRVQYAAVTGAGLVIGGFTNVEIGANNLGRAATGSGVNATLVPLDAGTSVLNGPLGYPSVPSRGDADPIGAAPFLIGVADSVTPGRLLRFRAEFRDDAGLYCRDTVELAAGVPTARLVDPANSLANWFVAGSWGLKSDASRGSSPFFTDSPGKYPANYNAALTLKGSLDLSHGVHAWLTFDNRWALETDFDATVIEASLDSIAWTPLKGRATVTGVNVGGVQPSGKPVYEGQRHLWKGERVDLSAFCGPTATQVRLRFRTISDGSTQFDGFDFDTLRADLYDPAAQPAVVAVESALPAAFEFQPPSPNPAHERAVFRWSLPHPGNSRLEILDVQGRRVALLADGRYDASRFVRGWDLRDDGGHRVAPGVYLARLVTAEGTRIQRLAVLR